MLIRAREIQIYVVTDECETEETIQSKFIKVKQVECERTGYENTITQARPQKKQREKSGELCFFYFFILFNFCLMARLVCRRPPA